MPVLGVYLAPADTFKLCDECMKVPDLVWEGGQAVAAGSSNSAVCNG
jgi:hypothetical protein